MDEKIESWFLGIYEKLEAGGQLPKKKQPETVEKDAVSS